jgi:hypothetical protein
MLRTTNGMLIALNRCGRLCELTSLLFILLKTQRVIALIISIKVIVR